jgi:nitrite reductase (NADH) small subunit
MVICLANVNGEFSALDNVCPHRGGPLGQGSVEGESVICPWHSWTFNLKTGIAEAPVTARAKVIPVKVENGDVLAELEQGESS